MPLIREAPTVDDRGHADREEPPAPRSVRRRPAAALRELEARGARRADVGQGDADRIALRDPEGNEFCLL